MLNKLYSYIMTDFSRNVKRRFGKKKKNIPAAR